MSDMSRSPGSGQSALSSMQPMTDPYFRGRYQEKLGEVRAAIKEIEYIVGPIRRSVEAAEVRLAILRRTEASYMEALDA